MLAQVNQTMTRVEETSPSHAAHGDTSVTDRAIMDALRESPLARLAMRAALAVIPEGGHTLSAWDQKKLDHAELLFKAFPFATACALGRGSVRWAETGFAMNKQDYDRLAEIVFRTDSDGKPTYPGYRPDVLELPNGDGRVDADKRYAHVAGKYMAQYVARPKNFADAGVLAGALDEAHKLACVVAHTLGVPDAFWPRWQPSALRILEYPVGATSNLHTDFDLFTLMIFRDQPECFVAHDRGSIRMAKWGDPVKARLREARKLNAQLHIGELGELIGLGPATPHEVIASDKPQHAIVYFAIPDHAAVLPTGQTVGEWLTERMSRSRTYK